MSDCLTTRSEVRVRKKCYFALMYIQYIMYLSETKENKWAFHCTQKKKKHRVKTHRSFLLNTEQLISATREIFNERTFTQEKDEALFNIFTVLKNDLFPLVQLKCCSFVKGICFVLLNISCDGKSANNMTVAAVSILCLF